MPSILCALSRCSVVFHSYFFFLLTFSLLTLNLLNKESLQEAVISDKICVFTKVENSQGIRLPVYTNRNTHFFLLFFFPFFFAFVFL